MCIITVVQRCYNTCCSANKTIVFAGVKEWVEEIETFYGSDSHEKAVALRNEIIKKNPCMRGYIEIWDHKRYKIYSEKLEEYLTSFYSNLKSSRRL